MHNNDVNYNIKEVKPHLVPELLLVSLFSSLAGSWFLTSFSSSFALTVLSSGTAINYLALLLTLLHNQQIRSPFWGTDLIIASLFSLLAEFFFVRILLNPKQIINLVESYRSLHVDVLIFPLFFFLSCFFFFSCLLMS